MCELMPSDLNNIAKTRVSISHFIGLDYRVEASL